jgi:hypothetical protein
MTKVYNTREHESRRTTKGLNRVKKGVHVQWGSHGRTFAGATCDTHVEEEGVVPGGAGPLLLCSSKFARRREAADPMMLCSGDRLHWVGEGASTSGPSGNRRAWVNAAPPASIRGKGDNLRPIRSREEEGEGGQRPNPVGGQGAVPRFGRDLELVVRRRAEELERRGEFTKPQAAREGRGQVRGEKRTRRIL